MRLCHRPCLENQSSAVVTIRNMCPGAQDDVYLTSGRQQQPKPSDQGHAPVCAPAAQQESTEVSTYSTTARKMSAGLIQMALPEGVESAGQLWPDFVPVTNLPARRAAAMFGSP
jgi:hypothetical protein